MINLIYGAKGSGKTQRILREANDSINTKKGDVVFIDADNSQMLRLSHQIRLIDLSEYDIKGDAELAAFIKGLLAANKDVEKIFIDGIAKITGLNVRDTKSLFAQIEAISAGLCVDFVITISADDRELPAFLNKYKQRVKTA